MRKFEKISFPQFKKDIGDNINLYNLYSLPKRSTKNSAGYDFESLIDFVIKPNETIKIPLGIKVSMDNNNFLMITVRSSMGFKYNVRMVNQVGIIDSDYYNNIENEGHMWLKLQNHGENDYLIRKGDKICQGIFLNYLLVDNEDEILSERTSGIGSTDKEAN